MDAPSYPLYVGDVATFNEFPPRQAPDGWASGWPAAAGGGGNHGRATWRQGQHGG